MGLLDNTSQAQYYQGSDYGNYQFTSLENIINQFIVAYVGEDKIIPKVKRTDVQFHAMRALQELSFDTFKSCKSQEITVPASLQMILPQDYVNYTKISWADSSGIKHLLYPTNKTSNPFKPQIDSDDDFLFDSNGNLIPSGNLITNGNFIGESTVRLSGSAVGTHHLDDWSLNEHWKNLSQYNTFTPTLHGYNVSNPITNSEGWFHFNNSIIGYNVPNNIAFIQNNLPIINGEQYTITYTISGYSSGSFRFVIFDERNDYTSSTSRTADGTYTETLTAGEVIGSQSMHLGTLVFYQDDNTALGNATIDNISMIRVGDDETSTTWSNYKSTTPSENNTDDYKDNTYWPAGGERYGLDPQYAQANGSFYIDCNANKIHFSSNISGKTIVLDYISDGLGTDEEMVVHKFAEEAMYKWIAHAVLSTRSNIPEYQINRFKKERFAAIRTAKLRLSNLKIEEITQVLRGKSKWIKH